MRFSDLLFYSVFFLIVSSCRFVENDTKSSTEEIDTEFLIANAEEQFDLMLKTAFAEERIPRTVSKEGNIHWAKTSFDWTEGFFPGSLWYLYANTGNDKWKNAAAHFQAKFEDHKYRTDNHDLGFIFNTSFANGYEMTTGNEAYKNVMITAADSLITRFDSDVGCIKSWDTNKGWQSKRNWMFPVIIDNMMNLELLFKVSELTNDPKYKNIAITHANTTLKNHFRPDNSSYHVVDYNPDTGEVRNKETAQGYSNDSAWARGQAWGLYGYTVCYRYTSDIKYMEQAEKIASFIMQQKEKYKEHVPYWDYNAANIPQEPKDVSAAAITASALIELDQYSNTSYKTFIKGLLTEMSSEKYLAKTGENNFFLLKHAVGSIPHNNEINVPLNYADYYFIEAITRYKNTNQKKS